MAFSDYDFDDGSGKTATADQVQQAIFFARMFRDHSLLVHCHAGRCRSPAITLAVLADRLGEGREVDAVNGMLRLAPNAAPNLLVLSLAEQVLNRHGKLERAWLDRYEQAEEVAAAAAL
ncbi:hypothetical protein LJR231_005516 [Phyllobacterium sp. LjRoot231]|uniref:hypothetical protein n=1 Tax=Phyllobacterium sp. LjRoot231 TaxID=3342289 RepID=UPI003ECC6BB6